MIFPSTLGRNARSVIGLKRSTAARMSLLLQLRKWGSHHIRCAVRLTELGHTGHSRLAQKRRHDSDEHQDGCASMREGPCAQGRANGVPFSLSLTGCEG